jgi:hypothetical protein
VLAALCDEWNEGRGQDVHIVRDKAGIETSQRRPIAAAETADFRPSDWAVHLGIVVSFAAALGYPLVTGLLPASAIPAAVSHDCLLKSATGIPCPTCGFTRSCHALIGGNAVDSLKYNPFSPVYVLGLGILCILSIRAILRRRPLLLSPRVSTAVLVVLASAWLLKLLGPREFW